MRNSMRAMSACAVVCVVLFASPTFGANVYDVEIYDGFDPDWSMDGGTITTNGFIGRANETNIGAVFTDWSIRFTSPTASYELTPANSEFSLRRDAGGTGFAEVDALAISIRDPFKSFLVLRQA